MTEELQNAGRAIGYARVSTDEQDAVEQREALKKAGCVYVYNDTGSGASRARPELKRCLDDLRPGDTLVVTRLDRLARSVKHLYEVVEDLQDKGIGFKSLRETFDTTTPSGLLMLAMLTAIAQFERQLIHERSRAGIRAAQQRGVVFGNPSFRRKDASTITMMKATQSDTFLARARDQARPWINHVVRLKPSRSWQAMKDYLDIKLKPYPIPPASTIRSICQRLADAGEIPNTIMDRPTPTTNDSAKAIAMRLRSEAPEMSLREIAKELKALGVSPIRAKSWSPTTIARLLD